MLIGYDTSRRFWRSTYPPDRAPKTLSGQGHPAFARGVAIDPADSRLARFLHADAEAEREQALHIVVPNQIDRRRIPGVRYHVCRPPFPEGSFYQLDAGLWVASPCFDFIALAATVALSDLIAFGNELCGRYGFDADSPRGFRSRQVPLVSKKELASYLDASSGRRGIQRARKALPFIVEGAASPMESLVQMLLCLPYRLGGYNLPVPHLNLPIDLNSQAAVIARRHHCVADLCYPHVKLDIEYHGRFDHSGSSEFDSDRARVNGLREMGYDVIELTSGQVRDFDCFESVALQIAKRLGCRIRGQYRGALRPRIELRQRLFGWNARNGMPFSR